MVPCDAECCINDTLRAGLGWSWRRPRFSYFVDWSLQDKCLCRQKMRDRGVKAISRGLDDHDLQATLRSRLFSR